VRREGKAYNKGMFGNHFWRIWRDENFEYWGKVVSEALNEGIRASKSRQRNSMKCLLQKANESDPLV